jgi:hypothetical protein
VGSLARGRLIVTVRAYNPESGVLHQDRQFPIHFIENIGRACGIPVQVHFHHGSGREG